MMRKFDVVIALEGIADARKQWTKAKHEFDQGVNKVMSRLLHEAAANFMSAEEVSRACGLKVNQVRSMMRLNGLDPKRGKRVLSATAAEALATNASLLGIAPHEMDLMSPLAYLPMGKQLRQQLQDQTVSQVHELDDDDLPRDDGRIVSGYATINEAVHDLHLRGGRLRWVCPVCGKIGDEVSRNDSEA